MFAFLECVKPSQYERAGGAHIMSPKASALMELLENTPHSKIHNKGFKRNLCFKILLGNQGRDL